MTWISPGRATGLRTAKAYGAVADGNSHPLSGFFGSLAAAQAAYPNANVTALTQEIDTCALLQLEHDYAGDDRFWDRGIYLCDQLIVIGATLAQGGSLRGAGQAGGGQPATLLRAKAGALTGTAVCAIDSQYTSVENIGVDGNCYAGTFGLGAFTLLANGTGAKYGWWPRNSAYSNLRNLSAGGCSVAGAFLDSSTKSGGGLGVADGTTFASFAAQNNGTLEIWSFTGTATGGTFTITVTNYLGSQTTAAIAFNASGATIAAALNALTTIAPTGDQGAVFTSQAAGLPANTAGPLGTNPAYIIFAGPMNGDGAIAVTVNTAGLTGGLVTATRIQQGQRGGGVIWGGGVDNNDQLFTKPRTYVNFGDGILINGGVNHHIEAPDTENNWCAGIRWTSAGATVLTGNNVHSPYAEGNWQSYLSDSIGGTHSQGCLLLRTNNSGTGTMLYKDGGPFNIDMGISNPALLVNGVAVTVP